MYKHWQDARSMLGVRLYMLFVYLLLLILNYILFVTLDFSFQLKLVLLKEFVIIRGFRRKDITPKKVEFSCVDEISEV